MPNSNRIHIAINREGGLFIFFLIGLGAAAIYSGNSGLMLFFCAMLAICILAVFIARSNLKQISVERRFCEEFFAGKEARIDLLIRNDSGKTVYGLHVYDTFEQNHRIGPVFVRQLQAGETATARYMCQFPTRGLTHFCGFQVRTRFPMPFFEFRLDIEQADSAFVYPQPIEDRDLLVFKPSESSRQLFRSRKNDSTIRELVHGKRTGRILWKLSARRQIWLESVPLRRPVFMDNPSIVVLDKAQIGTEKFERQISQVTDFALKRMLRNQSGEVCVGNQTLKYGDSPQQRQELLETLAQI